MFNRTRTSIKEKTMITWYFFSFFLIFHTSFPTASGMDSISQENNITINPIYNTKYMHQVASNKYKKQLSLFNGAVAYEIGLIRKLYDFGNISPIWGKDKNNRSIIKGYKPEGHAIIKLIHAFFYRIPGSTSAADFKETTQLNPKKSDEEILEALSNILKSCVDIRTLLSTIQEMIPTFNTLSNEKKLYTLWDSGFRKKIINQTTQKTLNTNTSYNKLINSQEHKSNLKKIQLTCDKLLTFVQEAMENIDSILKPGAKKSLFSSNELNPQNHKNFQVFLQSLLESSPDNKERLYPSYMTEIILLSFVYKKYGSNKKMLTKFYTILNNKLLIKKDELLIKKFDSENYQNIIPEYAKKKLNKIFQNSENLENKAEDILFLFNQLEEFPQENSFKEVTKYTVGSMNDSSTDCMENTLRNFIRLLAYDPVNKKFDLNNVLSKKIKQTYYFSKEFINFFTKYNDPRYDNSDDAHREWLKITSNIPYAFYDRTSTSDYKLDVKSGNVKGKSFIYLPHHSNNDSSSILLKHKVLNSLENAYVLKPSVYNLIIVLNHLLQLGLFNNINMDEQIINPNFVKLYLPFLCHQLGCNRFYSSNNWHEQNDMDIDFNNTITTTLVFDKYACAFTTHAHHGEMKITSLSKNTVQIPQISEKSELLELLIGTFTYKDTIEKLPAHMPWITYTSCFLCPFEKENIAELLMDALMATDSFNCYNRGEHQGEKKISNHTMYETVKLLMSLLEKYPDEPTRILLKNRLYKYLIKVKYESTYGIVINDIINNFKKFTEKDFYDVYDDIISYLLSYNYQPAFFKFFSLVKKQLNLDALEANIHNSKIDEICSILYCLLKEALKIEKLNNNNNKEFKSCISNIIDYAKNFVEKAIQSFTKLIEKNEQLPEFNLFNNLFSILEEFVQNNQYIDKAIQTVEAGLKNASFQKNQWRANNLLDKIAKTELGLKKIKEISSLSKIIEEKQKIENYDWNSSSELSDSDD